MTLIFVYKASAMMCFVRTILTTLAEGGILQRELTDYQGKNLEILDETIVCQISMKRKKVYFVVVYRSPSQTADEFNLFLDRLELNVETIQAKKNPNCIIITGDFNYRTQQW